LDNTRTWTSNAIGEAPCVKNFDEYGAAQSELIGKAVVLTDGTAGTVENVWLDELHRLRISIEGQRKDGPSQQSNLWSPRARTGGGLPGSRTPFKAFQTMNENTCAQSLEQEECLQR
jgi:hypothetical protein